MLLARMLRRQIRCLYYPTLLPFVQTESHRVARNTAVTAHIRSLRRKLAYAAEPMIRTIADTGYKIDFNEPYST